MGSGETRNERRLAGSRARRQPHHRAGADDAPRPFCTFLEVEQPESEFLLRVDPDEGIGFFEADGGIWKLEAKKNIADYFKANLADLIEAGKVVVMQ